MSNLRVLGIRAFAVLLPLFASAQTFQAIFTSLNSIINRVVGLLFFIATLIFFWGVVKFIATADNPNERQKSKKLMNWGIIGMAAMAAAWGVAYIIIQYMQIQNTPPKPLTKPTLK